MITRHGHGSSTLRGPRRGGVLLLVVLAIPLVVAMVTLGVDLGWVYLQEQKLNQATSSAAIAAANTLAQGGSASAARSSAKAFALANGLQLDDADVVVDPLGSNGRLVHLKKNRRVALFWGPVLGWSGIETRSEVYALGNSEASQLHLPPLPDKAASGIVPLGIPHADLLPVLTGEASTAAQIAQLVFQGNQQFVVGRRYLLKTGNQFRIDLPGLNGSASCEGSLDLPGPGNGAAKYRTQLMYGSGSPISLGALIATQPGNLLGPTRDGVDARCNADPTGSAATARAFSARLVVVPIVRTTGHTGPDDLGTGVPGLINIPYVFEANQVLEVIGLGKFFLDPYGSVQGNGAVTGQFVGYVGTPPRGQGPG